MTAGRILGPNRGLRELLADNRQTVATFSLLAVALALSLFTFWSFHSFHLDDWIQLPYIAEIDGRNPNLHDPFFGSDANVTSRLAYNLTTWSYWALSHLPGIDRVDLYHSIAPPILLAASLAAVYFMLVAVRFPSPVAAAGTVLWVLYFLAGSAGDRSPGAFFFDRIAQDKAIAWLVVAPVLLAVLCLADGALEQSAARTWTRDWRHLLAELQRAVSGKPWRLFIAFGVLAMIGSFVHPIIAVFAGLFVVAIWLKSVWSRASWPDPALVVAGLLSLVPALAVGLFLRAVAPSEGVHTFRTEGPSPGILGVDISEFGNKTIVDLGPTFVADPAYISLLNFVALGWIAWNLLQSRSTYALVIAAALYLVSAIAYVPGIPALMRPLTSTVVVFRLPWIMALSFVLTATDFCQWLIAEAHGTTRWIGVLIGGAAVAGGLAIFAFNYSDLERRDDRGGPSNAEIQVMSRLNELFDGGPEATALAGDDLSLIIPAYTSDVSVVSQPRVDTLPELQRNGEYRGDASAVVEEATRYSDILDLMAFWDANVLILESGDRLFRRSTPRPLQECYADEDVKILALKSKGGCPNPRGD